MMGCVSIVKGARLMRRKAYQLSRKARETWSMSGFVR